MHSDKIPYFQKKNLQNLEILIQTLKKFLIFINFGIILNLQDNFLIVIKIYFKQKIDMKDDKLLKKPKKN